MAAMTSKFYYVCVIQYYSDQWSSPYVIFYFVTLYYFSQTQPGATWGRNLMKIKLQYCIMLVENLQQACCHQAGSSDAYTRLGDSKIITLRQTCCNLRVFDKLAAKPLTSEDDPKGVKYKLGK